MSVLRKVATASAVALVLASVPSHLAAQERKAQPEVRAAAPGWFAALWSELAGWFKAETATPPQTGKGGDPTTQGSCAVDPYGCPLGG